MRFVIPAAWVALATTIARLAPGQALSSTTFVPPSAAEREQLGAAARDVLPNDVRRAPERQRAQRVFWTGITAGSTDGQPLVEHHYFDGVVEGDGGVWLSPWGEGSFCLLGLSPSAAARFGSERPAFVRAYGQPVMTAQGLCLRDAFVVVDSRRWSTLVLEYGPGGREDFSAAEASARGATHSHPEARLLTPLGYRAFGSVLLGKTNWDETPLGTGWEASLELSLRASVRSELAALVGTSAYPDFGAPRSLQAAVVYRHYLFGLGVAAGPLVDVPLQDDEPVFFGLRYLPAFGDARGAWGLAPLLGGGTDFTFSRDGDARFVLKLTFGIDGNLGAPRSSRQ